VTKGKQWTIQQETQLKTLVEANASLGEIAAKLQKTPGAIILKGKRLGLNIDAKGYVKASVSMPRDLPSVEEANNFSNENLQKQIHDSLEEAPPKIPWARSINIDLNLFSNSHKKFSTCTTSTTHQNCNEAKPQPDTAQPISNQKISKNKKTSCASNRKPNHTKTPQPHKTKHRYTSIILERNNYNSELSYGC
jgi:hypothetical protein